MRSIVPVFLLLLGSCGAAPSGGIGDEQLGDQDYLPGDGEQVTDDATGPGGDPSGGDTVPGDPSIIEQHLIVKANGTTIGDLMGAGDYTLTVLDRDNGLIFTLNDSTGYVAGVATLYYTAASCSGTAYSYLDAGPTCPTSSAPARRMIWGSDNDRFGFALASALLIESGTPTPFAVVSADFGTSCSAAGPTTYCGFALATSTVIPRSFALPITVTTP